MSTWCRHVHVRPQCFIFTEACSCRLDLAYFAGKKSNNRLVCKNAVALAYCGSCRLLVMFSWYKKSQINREAKASHFIVISKYGQESVYCVRSIPSGWYAWFNHVVFKALFFFYFWYFGDFAMCTLIKKLKSLKKHYVLWKEGQAIKIRMAWSCFIMFGVHSFNRRQARSLIK